MPERKTEFLLLQNYKQEFTQKIELNDSYRKKIEEFGYFFENKIKNNFSKKEHWFLVPDVPELEKATQNHKDGQEADLPSIVRIISLSVEDYRQQIGQTCGLTSFRMILGALGKSVPNFEELAGKPFEEIEGSTFRDHRKYINRNKECSDIQETEVRLPKFHRERYPVLREAIFKLLEDDNYLYARLNWQRLHGYSHPNGDRTFDHGIVVHGARETETTYNGGKVNYLITDPNHPKYHAIWISENLLFKALLDRVSIYGYKIKPPTISQRLTRSLVGQRPVERFDFGFPR